MRNRATWADSSAAGQRAEEAEESPCLMAVLGCAPNYFMKSLKSNDAQFIMATFQVDGCHMPASA